MLSLSTYSRPFEIIFQNGTNKHTHTESICETIVAHFVSFMLAGYEDSQQWPDSKFAMFENDRVQEMAKQINKCVPL